MTSPLDDRDRYPEGDPDSPPGGGRRGYAWVLGLVAVAGVLTVVSLLLGGLDGAPPPSR
ncbi:MAG TPA: hypothetical protein VNU66_12425 [Mycobacteriales bacterium]|nr:hypothetical protein [Mycobacteriales bacterium]